MNQFVLFKLINFYRLPFNIQISLWTLRYEQNNVSNVTRNTFVLKGNLKWLMFMQSFSRILMLSIFIYCVFVCVVCVHVCLCSLLFVCKVIVCNAFGGQRGQQILWNWYYWGLFIAVHNFWDIISCPVGERPVFFFMIFMSLCF